MSRTHLHTEVSGQITAQPRVFSYDAVAPLTAIFDYILIVATCYATAYEYYFWILSVIPDFRTYFGIGNVCAIIFVLLSHGLYRTNALISLRGQIRGISFNWAIVLFTLFLMLFLLKVGATYSRGALMVFSLLGLGLLISSRVTVCKMLSKALARGTLAGYSAIVIGDDKSLQSLSGLQILQRFGAREIGRFELPTDDQQQNLAIIDEAIGAARFYNAERVLLALNWGDERLRSLICERLQVLPLEVSLLPDRNITSILSHPTKQFVSEFTVEVQRTPLCATEFMAKRAVDLILGGAILISLLPLLAVVSILIKADSRGPVIFRQRRKGFNGREFNIYKFRTMTVLENGNNVKQVKRNDARVTRLGRILRATSIDELPQLVNVLRGQMSLVGPRPHPIALDDRYSKLIGDYAFRQHVKPGLTGWAQVHGFRGETAALELMERRIALDGWYINNWNIWLDLWIIMLTFFELMRPRNAY